MSQLDNTKRAVEAYEKKDKELREFMDEHEDIFSEFMRMVQARNTACQKAKDSVKSYGKTVGVFKYSEAKTLKFDAQALKEKLSQGQWNKIAKVSVDKNALEVLIDRGDIEKEDVDGTYDVAITKRCSGPKPWSIL